MQAAFRETLRVNATNCAFAGFFELDGAPSRIDHAALSPEKTTASGVGSFRRGYFTFIMIKIGNP